MDFDPYHQWLGIPPYEQPPHHYRLLGIALFEDHADVIESGADRQRAHVRSYLPGQYAAVAQRLLDEIAAAKTCLLQPARRAAYNAELRQRLAAGATVQPVATPVAVLPLAPVPLSSAPMVLQPGVAASPVPVPPVVPESGDPATVAMASPAVSSRLARQRRQGQRAVLAACLVAGVLLVIAAGLWKAASLDRGADRPAREPEMARTVVDKPLPTANGQTKPPPDPRPVETAPPKAEVKPPQPPNVVVTNPPPETPAPPSSRSPESTTSPAGETPAPAADPSLLKRRPVPTTEEQAPVRQVVEETYQLTKERSEADKLQIVQQMTAVADRANSPLTERFVLLRRAAEVASEAGDAARMLQIVDTLAMDFELDAIRAKETLLKRFAETATSLGRITALVEASRDYCIEAVKEDRFDEALSVATAVSQTCQRPAARAFKKEAVERRQRLAQLHERYAVAAAAIKKLEQSPSDAEANLAVGQWHCFSRGQWNKGLPYLAKSSDPQLAALAKRELDETPQQADEQVKLADAWYDLGQARSGEARDRMLARAGTWYERAKTMTAAGLMQLRIDKRLAEIAKASPPPADLAAAGGDARISETIAPGGWVDLMPRIDVTRDAVQGVWKHQGETLVVADGDFSRLLLPLRFAQADYDIEIEFNRTDGAEGLGLLLPVAGRQVAFLLSAANGSAGGLELFDGKRVSDGKNPTRRPGGIQNGRRNIVLVGVRNRNSAALIDAVLNGKPYARGAGEGSKFALPPEWALPDLDRPALAAHKSAVAFRRVRVRLIAGTASYVTAIKGADPAARPAGSAGEPVVPKLPEPRLPAPAANPSPPATNPPPQKKNDGGFVPQFPPAGPPAPPPPPRDF